MCNRSRCRFSGAGERVGVGDARGRAESQSGRPFGMLACLLVDGGGGERSWDGSVRGCSDVESSRPVIGVVERAHKRLPACPVLPGPGRWVLGGGWPDMWSVWSRPMIVLSLGGVVPHRCHVGAAGAGLRSFRWVLAGRRGCRVPSRSGSIGWLAGAGGVSSARGVCLGAGLVGHWLALDLRALRGACALRPLLATLSLDTRPLLLLTSLPRLPTHAQNVRPRSPSRPHRRPRRRPAAEGRHGHPQGD